MEVKGDDRKEKITIRLAIAKNSTTKNHDLKPMHNSHMDNGIASSEKTM